jgi:hypothetical protein
MPMPIGSGASALGGAAAFNPYTAIIGTGLQIGGQIVSGGAKEAEARRQANRTRALGAVNRWATGADLGLANNTTAGLDDLAAQRFQRYQGALANVPQQQAQAGAAEQAATQQLIAQHTAGIAPTQGWGAGVTARAAPHEALLEARLAMLARQRGEQAGAQQFGNVTGEMNADIGRQASDLQQRNALLQDVVGRITAQTGARYADRGPGAGYYDRLFGGGLATSAGKAISGAS